MILFVSWSLSKLSNFMRISFDLDDTLICYGETTPAEPAPPWYRRLFSSKEPMRLGTRSLVHRLQQMKWDVWVYTTSDRSTLTIKRWMWSHGIQIGGVINNEIHTYYHSRRGKFRGPSKNPRAFGIDLHIDDSNGVLLEGKRFGFPVVVIEPTDLAWTEKVISAVKDFQPGRILSSE
jgi:hypothetical protein